MSSSIGGGCPLVFLILAAILLLMEAVKMKTKELRSEYVRTGGTACPYCGGHKVTADKLSFADMGYRFAPVTCSDCGKKWEEVLQLSGVNLTK